MRKIQLPQGYTALVDDEDYERLNCLKWGLYFGGKTVYAYRNKDGSMHRKVMGIVDRSVHIDHIDRNGLNNQKYNLRTVDCAQNQWNAGIHVKNTSGYRGVSKKTGRDRYCVDIQIRGQGYCAGYYATKEEAAIAFNMAAIKHYGEYAFLNEVDMSIVLNRHKEYKLHDYVKYIFKTNIFLEMRLGCHGKIVKVLGNDKYLVQFRNHREPMEWFQLERITSESAIKRIDLFCNKS